MPMPAECGDPQKQAQGKEQEDAQVIQ